MLLLELFWIVFILFIWFDTDAFLEYCKIFGLRNFFKIGQYEDYKKEFNPGIDYHSYLRQKHNSFFTRLITCVPCVNFWISFVFCFVFGNIIMYPLVYLLSYIIYKLIKKHIHG